MCGRRGASTRRTVRPASTPSVRGAVLVAAVEEELHPQADAQEGAVGGDPAPDRLHEPAPSQPFHRGPGRTDAGHHEGVGAGQVRLPVRQDDLGAGRAQGLVDAHEVAGAVVDDGDPGHPRLPFVEAAPPRRGSGATATRSARPRALNAASATWWSLRPDARRWRVVPDVRGERLEGMLDELGRQGPDPLPAEGDVDDGVRPPADVEDRRREGFVHRHRRVAEAADPGSIAERLGHGTAQDKGDVLDRVVLVHLEVAGHPDGQVEEAVMRERSEQVVVEAHAGAGRPRPPSRRGRA